MSVTVKLLKKYIKASGLNWDVKDIQGAEWIECQINGTKEILHISTFMNKLVEAL